MKNWVRSDVVVVATLLFGGMLAACGADTLRNRGVDRCEGPDCELPCEGDACFAPLSENLGAPCGSDAACDSGQCECTDAQCTTGRCVAAEDDCVCGWGEAGACLYELNDGVQDMEDCDGDRVCNLGACTEVVGEPEPANDGAICTGMGDEFCDSGFCECAQADCAAMRCATSDCLCGFVDAPGAVCVGRVNDGINGPRDCSEPGEACYDGACGLPAEPTGDCIGVALSASSPTGAGTEGSPYIICTMQQFGEITRLMGATIHFALGTDIDLGSSWLDNIEFSGHFDGREHRLTYHMISSRGGLFGNKILEGASVANLQITTTVASTLLPGNKTYSVIATSNQGTIEYVTLDIDVPPGVKVWNAGGIVNWNSATGVIRGCTVRGTLHLYSDDFFGELGGIAASNGGGGVIDDCVVEADLFTNSVAGYSYVAGITGTNHRGGVVSHSTFTGRLAASGSTPRGSRAGGIVATCEEDSIVTACSSHGRFTATNTDSDSLVGGICAGFEQGVVLDSFSTGTLSLNGSAGQVAGIGVDMDIGVTSIERSYFAGVVPVGSALGGSLRAASFMVGTSSPCTPEMSCTGNAAEYFGRSHALYDSWDFNSVWIEQPSALPILR